MDQYEQTCCICFIEYSEDRVCSMLLPCRHNICFECLKLSVLLKDTCPFCKQNVSRALVGNELVDLQVLKQSSPTVTRSTASFEEEAVFELLDRSFFSDDVQTLVQRLKLCYQRLRQVITQRDLEFDMKWSIYDKVELEVQKLQNQLHSQTHINPTDIFNKIHQLSNEIEALKQGRWGSSLLEKYKEMPPVCQDESFSNFFVANKKKKGKRK